MARPLRVEFEGAIYHLCTRGNARQRIFWDDRDRNGFVELLSESARRFDVSIFCFVLMGNHVHLVAQTHRPNLSRWMHWLTVAYTVSFNRRHRASGHLFQGRYKSFLVQEGDYLLGLSRYIHLNPVRGMSLGRGTPSERRKRLRACRWSSYPGYAAKEPYPFVEEHMVLRELGGSRKGLISPWEKRVFCRCSLLLLSAPHRKSVAFGFKISNLSLKFFAQPFSVF
jgi:putative transposase